jgi:hypothetical protein
MVPVMNSLLYGLSFVLVGVAVLLLLVNPEGPLPPVCGLLALAVVCAYLSRFLPPR